MGRNPELPCLRKPKGEQLLKEEAARSGCGGPSDEKALGGRGPSEWGRRPTESEQSWGRRKERGARNGGNSCLCEDASIKPQWHRIQGAARL